MAFIDPISYFFLKTAILLCTVKGLYKTKLLLNII